MGGGSRAAPGRAGRWAAGREAPGPEVTSRCVSTAPRLSSALQTALAPGAGRGGKAVTSLLCPRRAPSQDSAGHGGGTRDGHTSPRGTHDSSPHLQGCCRQAMAPLSPQPPTGREAKPQTTLRVDTASGDQELGGDGAPPSPPTAPTRDAEPTEPHTLRLYTILLYFPFVQNHVAPLYFTKPPPAHGHGERGREGTPQRAAPPAPAHLGPAGHGVRHRIPLPPVRPACSSQPRPPACKSYCHGGIINRLSEWVNSYYILGYSLIHPH